MTGLPEKKKIKDILGAYKSMTKTHGGKNAAAQIIKSML